MRGHENKPRRDRKPKDPEDLGDGLYIRLHNDTVKLIRVYGVPWAPDTIREIKVLDPADVVSAVYNLKALAQQLKDYRQAFEAAL